MWPSSNGSTSERYSHLHDTVTAFLATRDNACSVSQPPSAFQRARAEKESRNMILSKVGARYAEVNILPNTSPCPRPKESSFNLHGLSHTLASYFLLSDYKIITILYYIIYITTTSSFNY